LAQNIRLLPGDAAGERRGAVDRRRYSALSFVYGGLRPRRRIGRRPGDEQRVLLDWHEPRVLFLGLAILLMSCADALFTLNLLTAGGEELNALMRFLLERDTRWFLWGKIGITALSVIALVTVARWHVLGRVPVLRLIELFCAGYVVLIAWELYLLGWRATSVGTNAVEHLRVWVAG
jgi:hypothetical protein